MPLMLWDRDGSRASSPFEQVVCVCVFSTPDGSLVGSLWWWVWNATVVYSVKTIARGCKLCCGDQVDGFGNGFAQRGAPGSEAKRTRLHPWIEGRASALISEKASIAEVYDRRRGSLLLPLVLFILTPTFSAPARYFNL
eukprot:scaffold246160_cov18-Tisochrysis_lutea.AAC.1